MVVVGGMPGPTVTDLTELVNIIVLPQPGLALGMILATAALARGRKMSPHYADYESLSPILVSSPPPGVDFRNCLPDPHTGHCCVDFVRMFSTTVRPALLGW